MRHGKKVLKAHRIMKYLTCGLAIFFVVGVVIVVLFGSNSTQGVPLPTACVAESGFLCKISSFTIPYANAGTLNVTIGQATGTNWVTANIAFLNYSQIEAPTTASYWRVGNIVQFSSGINSGTPVSVSIPVNSLSSTAIGTAIQGQIWAQYTNSSGGPEYYVEIATVTAKSVG